MVTTGEQIFMCDQLHVFGTEVLCFQKLPLLLGCGGTESLSLPDVVGYLRRLWNALVFVMLPDLAISISNWESTVSCSPYQREHPTLKDLITWDIWIFSFLCLDCFPNPFPVCATFFHWPHISLLCLLLIPPPPLVPFLHISHPSSPQLNPLNAELNPVCHLLALLAAHHILHVSRIRVNTAMLQSLTLPISVLLIISLF
jgi:hypothetical protein